MDCVGELTTIDNRLGRAGGPFVLRDSCLCQPDLPLPHLPVLARSAALLKLLLQDGAVDLELTSSVIALDPGLALATLQAASRENHGAVGIWQLPLAVVAAGCEQLLAIADCALKVESSFDCATSRKLRQLYLRCVQQACIAQMLTGILGGANPKQSYVAGLLFGLPGVLNPADAGDAELASTLRAVLPGSLPADEWTLGASSSAAMEEHQPVAASVQIADQVLELPEAGTPQYSELTQALAKSPLWQSWDDCNPPQPCRILVQAARLGKWAAANAPRLSPWEFMARFDRHKSWE